MTKDDERTEHAFEAVPPLEGALSEYAEQIETMSSKKIIIDAELEKLQYDSFKYFLHESNPANGLVIDKTEAGSPASIAATGLALASYPAAVERVHEPDRDGRQPDPRPARHDEYSLRHL